MVCQFSRGAAAWQCTPLALVLLLVAVGRAAAGGNQEALQWIDRLEERLAKCRDYQYELTSFERKGDRKERRCYRMFVKDQRLVRIKVVEGRGKGSEATLDAKGRVRGRKSGILKSFPQTLKPTDERVRSLRGTPFWEAACHNFLKELRARVAAPGAQCELGPDPEQPDRLVLTLRRLGAAHERYWIDPRLMCVVKGELFEGDLLVKEFSIRDLKENVGLSDGFFAF